MFIILNNNIMKILLYLFSFFYIHNTTVVGHDQYVPISEQSENNKTCCQGNCCYVASSLGVTLIGAVPLALTISIYAVNNTFYNLLLTELETAASLSPTDAAIYVFDNFGFIPSSTTGVILTSAAFLTSLITCFMCCGKSNGKDIIVIIIKVIFALFDLVVALILTLALSNVNDLQNTIFGEIGALDQNIVIGNISFNCNDQIGVSCDSTVYDAALAATLIAWLFAILTIVKDTCHIRKS